MTKSSYFKNHNPANYANLAPGLGCIVSNRVSVDGEPIRYMAKEEASGDSGWVFYAGDEDETYTSDSKNFQVFSLNTIANIDPSILPFLKAPAGAAFEKLAAYER